MTLWESPVSGAFAGVGVEAASPGHTVNRALPYGSNGHYRISAVSGTIAAALAALAQLFYFRWTDATRLAVVSRVKLDFQALTGFTAATLTDFGFDMIKASSVSAGGGGTDLGALAIPRMRTSMGASLIATGNIRIATTAALTALTTLDAMSIAQSVGDQQRVNPAAATEEQRVNDPTLLFQPDVASGEHPLVLAQNEGFALRNRGVWPAAGTGIIRVEVSWAEVTAY